MATARSPADIYPFQQPPAITPGKLRIQVHSCFLNVPVKRPYIRLTLGDQKYQTSISEYPQGRWHECFEFSVSFHAQLFDTIQMDVYDAYVLLPDWHVGRAEIRIQSLKGMPDTFTSYYEVWEKRLSTGASSTVGRQKTLANNVGAIQAEISYIYQVMDTPEQQDTTLSSDLGEMKISESRLPRRSSRGNTIQASAVSDEELYAEFRHQLKCQREGPSTDIAFHKYEEGGGEGDASLLDNSESDGDLGSVRRESRQDKAPTSDQHASDTTTTTIHTKTTVTSTVSSWFGFPPQPKGPSISSRTSSTQSSVSTVTSAIPRSLSYDAKASSSVANVLSSDDEALKSFPILDAIGSWTVNKETNQVLRTIGKLLAAFGQGFELSNLQILTGFTLLEKFYNALPRDRTQCIVEDLSEIELAAHFWKFSLASYGWKGLNFIGKGNGYFSDAIRDHSDVLSILEYLSLPKQDLLAYEFRSSEAFRPSYFIARDRPTNSIVLCIRGTMSVFDTMTDLVCEYEPWRGGLVHKGMKSSATWFFRNVAPKLVAYTNEHSTSALYITGHSLGAATAAILTIMLLDFIEEFQKDKDTPFTLRCFGYAPACGLSLDLSEKYKDYIQSFVFADDVVSKLSYGSMMNVKELIIASAEASQNLGVGQLWLTGKPEGEQWEKAFAAIAESRRRCVESRENPRLYVAGSVYQFWLDPSPQNNTRIVIEKTDAERVSGEVVVKRSILLDHLPTNFDLAFRRAREALMLNTAPQGVLDPQKSSTTDNVTESIKEAGLKGTTHRTGGHGEAIDDDEAR